MTEQSCNTHPRAPHGFDRNSSHSAGRYVCTCEGWEPYNAGYNDGLREGMAIKMSDEPIPWITAVDAQLVSLHLGVANLEDSFEEASKKLNMLIDYNITIAHDPAVNGGYSLVNLSKLTTKISDICRCYGIPGINALDRIMDLLLKEKQNAMHNRTDDSKRKNQGNECSTS